MKFLMRDGAEGYKHRACDFGKHEKCPSDRHICWCLCHFTFYSDDETRRDFIRWYYDWYRLDKTYLVLKNARHYTANNVKATPRAPQRAFLLEEQNREGKTVWRVYFSMARLDSTFWHKGTAEKYVREYLPEGSFIVEDKDDGDPPMDIYRVYRPIKRPIDIDDVVSLEYA